MPALPRRAQAPVAAGADLRPRADGAATTIRNGQRHADNDAPEFSGGLRDGAETWSADGRAHGPKFPGLTEAERAAGQTYATHLPSMFVVGHVDYVRTVSLRPLGPEQTELTAEWLFAPEALASDSFDLDNIVSFGMQVLEEDAAVCEINQRGLHSLATRPAC